MSYDMDKNIRMRCLYCSRGEMVLARRESEKKSGRAERGRRLMAFFARKKAINLRPYLVGVINF